MLCCICTVLAGFEDKQIEMEVATQKNKAHMILTEFAYIAYSGCEESLNEKGILPSQIKYIYKTWYKKARVFNENKLFGLIFWRFVQHISREHGDVRNTISFKTNSKKLRKFECKSRCTLPIRAKDQSRKSTRLR